MKHGGNVWQGRGPGDWLDFSANLRPEGPPDWVMDTLRRALGDVRYYPDRAMTAAREGLAAYAGVPMENVLPTAGGEAAIDLALTLRQGPVDAEPVTFGAYAERAILHGRPLGAGSAATVVRCNPNNPTGSVRSRRQMLDEAKAGAELIADEAFIDFCPEYSLRGDVCDTVTVVGSLTKILGIPGVRLGYVIASPRNIARLEKQALDWQLSALASAVAAELPNHLSQIAADAAVNTRRRAAFAAELAQLGASVYPSRANFLLCDFGREMTGAAERLKARGILVRTCASFGLGGSHLRLAVKTEQDNQRFIKELKQCLAY